MGGMAEAPRLVIVDLNAVHGADEWSSITSVEQSGIPVLVFGPHRNVEGLRAAKAAGVSRVVSNGQFHGDMVGFITRYVSGEADVANANVHTGDDEGEGVE